MVRLKHLTDEKRLIPYKPINRIRRMYSEVKPPSGFSLDDGRRVDLGRDGIWIR